MQDINWFGALPTQPRTEILNERKLISADNRSLMLEYGKDYFDGNNPYGYGGYKYDGRFAEVVQKMIEHYGLNSESRILEIGCAKGYLLYEFYKAGIEEVHGIDISDYAIENVPEEMIGKCQVGSADDLSKFEDNYFDLVISKDTLHNLVPGRAEKAIEEVVRVGKGQGFLQINSYSGEGQRKGLETWVITIKSKYSTEEWIQKFRDVGYSGDYHFLTFDYMN